MGERSSILTTNEAREKSIYLESLEFEKDFDVCLIKF
jgi:hypothetical protein